MMIPTRLETGHRIQLPAAWVKELGLTDLVSVERTSDGILIRPLKRLTWDEISATKLVINSAPPDETKDEDVELTGDDFLY